ncbi:hypothetical protein [Microbacterium rhizomatis]|uniref:Uncharacterized protein n=1 Tax=Microbacterium rhizomatis TaxID=1631477 RepID=A0A5J5IYZ9_9MICO|nr:hypothetical protein [Microbacterium rhizomatis]KAA9105520.1 hypothetical protein F6B43_17235 [Microbacterium rhizomatis]
MALAEDVAEALEQLVASFPDAVVTHREDGVGGTFVKVEPLALGDRFNLRSSWIGFHLVYSYPEAQVYPHVCAPGLTLRDGTALQSGDGFQQVAWGPDGDTEPVTQLSRSSRNWDPDLDTAASKLHRILEWLRG